MNHVLFLWMRLTPSVYFFLFKAEFEFHIIQSFILKIKGGRRFSEGTSADREIQRTLMEVIKFIFY